MNKKWKLSNEKDFFGVLFVLFIFLGMPAIIVSINNNFVYQQTVQDSICADLNPTGLEFSRYEVVDYWAYGCAYRNHDPNKVDYYKEKDYVKVSFYLIDNNHLGKQIAGGRYV